MVIGRAVIRDLAGGPVAARAFSILTLTTGVAPVVAPLLGSALVGHVGWRGVLWVVTGVTAAITVAVIAVVRETHPRRARGGQAADGETGSGVRSLVDRRFAGYAAAYAFGFAVMMAYISASPFLYQVMLGASPLVYGLAFGANAAGLIAMGSLAARLAHSYSTRMMVGLGLLMVTAATVGLLVLVVVDASTWLIPIPIFVAVSALGLVLGNATALALEAVPRAAGSASAVLGAAQFGLGAAVSPMVSIRGDHDPMPLAVVMTSCALIALLSFAGATVRADPTS